jgi:heme exporter protein B
MRLPEVVRHTWAVASKDLLIEFRSRTAIVSAAMFVILVLLVFTFARDPTAVAAVDLAPSILWVTLTYAAPLALVIVLATIGFVSVGTLFSAMTVRTRVSELLLAVLVLPFMIPPLMWAARATGPLLAGRPLSDIIGWLKMLAAYDIVFVGLALLLFPATVNE